jgi:transcriptional repressor NF-X1
VKPNEQNESLDNTELAQSLVQAFSVQTIDLSLARKQQPIQQQLECDDECRIAQRNKALAQALNINPDESRSTAIVYTDFLLDYARKNIEFVQTVERDFAQLVEDTKRHGVQKRCHTFKPMKTNERHVIHELATFYGLETQAMDPEPQRNVVAFAKSNMCKIPSVTLSEIIRRAKLKVPPPVTLK